MVDVLADGSQVVDGAMNSLGTFLSIELQKFNRLLKKMKATLSEIRRAIKGLVRSRRSHSACVRASVRTNLRMRTARATHCRWHTRAPCTPTRTHCRW